MWEQVITHTIAVIVGIFLGFFLVIAPLFADSGTAHEYLLALFILDFFFFAAGFSFSFSLPGFKTSISLAVPVVLLALVLAISDKPEEFFHILIFTVFPLVAVVASIGGGILGSWAREKWDDRKERSSH